MRPDKCCKYTTVTNAAVVAIYNSSKMLCSLVDFWKLFQFWQLRIEFINNKSIWSLLYFFVYLFILYAWSLNVCECKP